MSDRSHAERRLAEALELAARGCFGVAPNPMVGAIVERDGRVVGRGFHRRAGGRHAEVEALAEAAEATRGATLYVTLEPCSHHGRTPPCVDAVVAAGISRVVACHRDPDPRVSGKGLDQLRAGGVEVESGQLVESAALLNWKYLSAVVNARPAVTLKWAMSLDGRIATRAGDSQWISSDSARRWALAQREVHDAILVGSGTVLADDPRLTRRLGEASGPIIRVVLDRRLQVTAGAALFGEPGPVLIYTESDDRDARERLEAAGAVLPPIDRVTPSAVLEDLGSRAVQSLLVEGGGEVLGAFVTAGTFDRVAVDCGALLIGGRSAPGPVGAVGVERLTDAVRLEGLDVERIGNDVVITGFKDGCLQGLYESVAG